MQRDKVKGGVTRITSETKGMRIGLTGTWLFADATDIGATFGDGKPARVGDHVLSTNGLSVGEMYVVTKVYPSGNVDVAVTNIRLRMFDDTGWLPIQDSGSSGVILQAGFTNYPGWEAAAYRRVDDQVMMKGLIRNNAVAKAASTILFTLPAGFRCGEPKHVVTAMNAGVGLLNIYPDGRVVSNLAVPANGWITLDVPYWQREN